MTEELAVIIVRIVGSYLAVSALFALPFVLFGAARVDPAARGGTWGFRVLILPGAVALWPLLAWRWIAGTSPIEHNAHRDAARTFVKEHRQK